VVNSAEAADFRAKGFGGKAYLIPFRGISAIVAPASFEELDPTDENLLAHETVLQEALIEKGLDVAPMRFCTVVGSEADVKKLLHEAYLPFRKSLLKVSGKLEVGVKVFIDRAKMEGRFGTGTLEKSREIAEKIHKEMKQLAILDCLNELLTDDMIMNASFLIGRGEEEKFMERLVELDRGYTDFLQIKLYGPNSAYNFVSMPEVNRDGTIRR